MTAVSLHKRKFSFFVTLLIAFSAFTADILDLREELQILPRPDNCLDDNITSGLTSEVAVKADSIPFFCFVQLTSSFETLLLYLLTQGPRAPPRVVLS